MRYLKTLFLVFFIFLAINFQEFKFEEETIDCEKIIKGSDGERIYLFTNVRDAPTILKNVQSSCGCTFPKKSEKLIMFGKKGAIKVFSGTKRVSGWFF